MMVPCSRGAHVYRRIVWAHELFKQNISNEYRVACCMDGRLQERRVRNDRKLLCRFLCIIIYYRITYICIVQIYQ